MKTTRLTYTVFGRNWLGLLRPVLRFKTSLNLDSLPGLMVRIKRAFGPVVRVSV